MSECTPMKEHPSEVAYFLALDKCLLTAGSLVPAAGLGLRKKSYQPYCNLQEVTACKQVTCMA